MSAVEAIGAARAFGIHLELDGDDLLLEASGLPPDASWRRCRTTSLRSCGSYTQPRMARRRSTGTSYSINVQPLLSLQAGCRAPTPRLRPSNAASSNG